MPTRGRCSRSASRHVPMVRLEDTSPFEWSRSAVASDLNRDSSSGSAPSSLSCAANDAARGPCAGSTVSFSRRVS
jgi:hypothetical protein